MGQQILLGVGVLNWDGSERRSDRYGFVNLFTDMSMEKRVNFSDRLTVQKVRLLIAGRKVRLIAVVKETRKSSHIGDLFRIIFPSTPSIGEIIPLGEGLLTFLDDTTVGLKPLDGRKNDWLDPHALYRVHEQTVALVVEIMDGEMGEAKDAG
jgi:hypothetical protein